MLSLPPRFDLFHFQFPKDFIPKEIEEKYYKYLMREKSVIRSPIEYLNESIVGISIPGIGDAVVQQPQTSHNSRYIENVHDNTYRSAKNPISLIDKVFTITLRCNQSFINYFLLYETFFWFYAKSKENKDIPLDVFCIDILNEEGQIVSTVKLFDLVYNSISGLEFSYNKVDINNDTFEVSFQFNNIDYEML